MNIFESFIKSLYDFKGYAKFLTHSALKVTAYFLLVAGIFGALSSIPSIPEVKQTQHLIDNHVSEIPEFQIKDNKLQVDGIKIIKDEKMILKFDPNTDDLEQFKDVKAVMFFGKDSLHVKQADGSFANTKYDKFTNTPMNKKFLTDYAESLKVTPYMLAMMSAVKSIFIGLMMALITAFVSLQFTKMGGMRLKFGELLKLSIYATTIPIIVYGILCAIGITFPFIAWILIIIPVLYVRRAINLMMAEEEAKTKKIKKKK